LMGPNAPLFLRKGMIRCRDNDRNMHRGMFRGDFFFNNVSLDWFCWVGTVFLLHRTYLIYITVYASFASYSQPHITWWFIEYISIHNWLHFVYDRRMEQTILQLYQTIRCTKMPLTCILLNQVMAKPYINLYTWFANRSQSCIIWKLVESTFIYLTAFFLYQKQLEIDN